MKEIAESNLNKELDVGVVLTSLLVCHPPQRMLFAGTDTGQLRSFAFPISGDWVDVPCHAAAVTRLRISQFDTYAPSHSRIDQIKH